MRYEEEIVEHQQRMKEAETIRLRMDGLMNRMIAEDMTDKQLMTLRRERDVLSIRLAQLTGNLSEIDVCLTTENCRYQMLF
jgi:hypothetical protein